MTNLERALTYIPDGSCTLSKRPAAWPTGGPRFADSGTANSMVWCDNQRFYYDLVCALGALTLGHSHPHVRACVTNQMSHGPIFSLPSTLEGKVAQRLVDKIPCADKVKFVKTGSEACSAAVRIARIATGRTTILTTPTSYHGWHDQMIAAKAVHPGVPAFMEEGIYTFRYNDLEDCEEMLRRLSQGTIPVAAVMMEPVQGEEPLPGFLQGVVDLAHKYGALVIFDEMLCGGRLALAGAQDYYGVTPDLATFGKAFGGGLPLAFVVGRSTYMQHAWPVSGTFSGDALALAACSAVLDVYEWNDVIGSLWRVGKVFKEAILSEAHGEIEIHGHDPRFWLTFKPQVDRRLAMSVMVQQCQRQDILMHPAVIFASASYEPETITLVAQGLAQATKTMVDGIRQGTLRQLLVGECYQDSVR